MITNDPKTWMTCVFCGHRIPPYFISRQVTHAVSGTGLGNNSTYAHEDCILSRHSKPSEATTDAPTAKQEGMDFGEAVA